MAGAARLLAVEQGWQASRNTHVVSKQLIDAVIIHAKWESHRHLPQQDG
jgi:hypothetical protein